MVLVDPLDAKQIALHLPNDSQGLWHIQVVPTTVSTHTELSLAARKGAPLGTVLLAEAQTAGRGRGGRNWVTPYGSQMALSLIWRLDAPAGGLSGMSLVTGLACVDSLVQFGLTEVKLKWPNDLYWRGQKLGGILVEVQGNPMGQCVLIVSVGINVTTCEAAEDTQTIDQPFVDCQTVLRGRTDRPDRNRLTALFLTAWHQNMTRFVTDGFEPFQTQWKSYDWLYGKEVVVKTANSDVMGKSVGIDPFGALWVQTAKGRETFYSGDVSLRASKSELKSAAVCKHKSEKAK